jgi:hypothetical protein
MINRLKNLIDKTTGPGVWFYPKIDMTKEFELLVDLHKDHSRQGPGSDEVTKQVLDLCKLNYTKNSRIIIVMGFMWGG